MIEVGHLLGLLGEFILVALYTLREQNAWYKQQFSQKYQTLINAVLKKYMLEHNC